MRELRRHGDEIAKYAVMPQGLADTAEIFRAARETEDVEKILLGMGPYGTSTRILAERLGSLLSFTSPRDEAGVECAGPGQFDPVELEKDYRFRSLRNDTVIYGIIGSPLTATSSPMIHNPAFDRAGLNAVYVPFRTDSLPAFFNLADELSVKGISVTIPFKEDVVFSLRETSAEVKSIGACNTAIRQAVGWSGYNTDAVGFSDSLLAFLGRKHLRGKHIAIIGAGGVARAVASEVHRLGGRACVLNRSVVRAKEVAERFGFAWGSLDDRGISLMDKFHDVIVQTTSVGMEGDLDADPIGLYRFLGSERVIDLIYKPPKTRMLARAEAAGCSILNGRDMLERQARLQFALFTGMEFPEK